MLLSVAVGLTLSDDVVGFPLADSENLLVDDGLVGWDHVQLSQGRVALPLDGGAVPVTVAKVDGTA